MKSVLLVLLIGLSSWGSLTRIRDRNRAAQQAAAQYARGNFSAAATLYQQAVEQFGSKSEALLLNLAHACAQAGRPVEARAYYGRLLTSKTPALRAAAQQQLAVLRARQGEYAQAIGLLRQALLTDPTSQTARYNYETLRNYLARHGDTPRIPPPGGGPKDARRPPDPRSQSQEAGAKAGDDRQGQLDDPTQPNDPRNAPESRPDQAGRSAAASPSADAGRAVNGGLLPGRGTKRNVASGSEPGGTRGLSNTADGAAARGRSHRAGTEQAEQDEARLQTQRARLQQMNLSSGQAQQLLDALSAAEQQYLQQLPRKATVKPALGRPAW